MTGSSLDSEQTVARRSLQNTVSQCRPAVIHQPRIIVIYYLTLISLPCPAAAASLTLTTLGNKHCG